MNLTFIKDYTFLFKYVFFYLGIKLLHFLVVNKYLFYYKKMILAITLMPLYRIILFFIRAIGIINIIDYDSSWKRKCFSAELKEILDYIILKFTIKNFDILSLNMFIEKIMSKLFNILFSCYWTIKRSIKELFCIIN